MSDRDAYGVVWFKRDLRWHDHAALTAAARHGKVLALYVVEPSLWSQTDAATQHYQFVLESLHGLDAALRERGGVLHVLTGEVTEILQRLNNRARFAHLYSHEETGNDASFRRDRAVAAWCRAHGVTWQEFPQFGVKRRLESRNTWQRQWEEHVRMPQQTPDRVDFVELSWAESAPPHPGDLGLTQIDPARRQRGGRAIGLSVLHNFLDERSAQYRGGISSPLSAPTACSRISPYLAYGCLSLREVVQATRAQMLTLPEGDRRRAGLKAFTSRLHWHCHFIQKLESEPELEYRNLHRGYDGLRENDWNDAHFEALKAGCTGWPLVDACVAMLRETGWINFRMRAMLVSVAAYPLWLHWRPVGEWLAQQFLDYEPGIHWSQMQMQSGTTGINTARIYNPVKQARDHDPHGHFVRQWLPAMRRVPPDWLFEPWLMPQNIQEHCGVRVGVDIPEPIVDLAAATRLAKSRLYALRARPEVQAAEAAIVEKHASRKRSESPRGKRKPDDRQMALEF